MKQPLRQIDSSSNPGTLQALLIHRPDAHPLWAYYMLSLVHLRPMAGQKPPYLEHPDSTHEIYIIALDPDTTPDPSDLKTIRWLTPINLSYQLRGKTDESARAIFAAFARAIDTGELSPDTDFRRAQKVWLDSQSAAN